MADPPRTRPVKVYFLAYSGTMQTRLMQLMADKLSTSIAIEGELSDKGLAALSATSGTRTAESIVDTAQHIVCPCVASIERVEDEHPFGFFSGGKGINRSQSK
jgi:hypothetical protein